jgi:hypothetical protein
MYINEYWNIDFLAADLFKFLNSMKMFHLQRKSYVLLSKMKICYQNVYINI